MGAALNSDWNSDFIGSYMPTNVLFLVIPFDCLASIDCKSSLYLKPSNGANLSFALYSVEI